MRYRQTRSAGTRPARCGCGALTAALLAAALAACDLPAPESAPPSDPPVEADRPREGPWRVECWQEDELVFEHNRIYRVWHPEGRPPYWAYETADGLRFRGRMGTDLTCVWIRL